MDSREASGRTRFIWHLGEAKKPLIAVRIAFCLGFLAAALLIVFGPIGCLGPHQLAADPLAATGGSDVAARTADDAPHPDTADGISAGTGGPRRTLPVQLTQLRDPDRRKTLFIGSILPAIRSANRAIHRERAELHRLLRRHERGLGLDARDRAWLRALGRTHGMKGEELDRAWLRELATRVDIVPPSLALAQAALESGWGTSRFAQDGNALFGQHTHDPADDGMRPRNISATSSIRVKTFETPVESVFSYVRLLNSHPAYREFRARRAALRGRGEILDGRALAATLRSYSERGAAYVRDLKLVIVQNDLSDFDGSAPGLPPYAADTPGDV